MELPDLYPIIASAATALGTSYFAKGENSPIQTLSDLWYLAGPGKLHENVLDKKNERALMREKEKNEKTANTIAMEVVKIAEENLHQPRENIARPSIAALDEYGSEEHSREMFARLIAASMDKTKDEIAQQSFVEIVKNLSPIDANVLSYLSDERARGIFPIGNISLKFQTENTHSIEFRNLFFLPKVDNSKLVSTSIANIERLGLIKTDFSNHLSNRSAYHILKELPIFSNLEKDLATEKEKLNSYDKSTLSQNDLDYIAERTNSYYELKEGHLAITPLGLDFMTTCISSD